MSNWRKRKAAKVRREMEEAAQAAMSPDPVSIMAGEREGSVSEARLVNRAIRENWGGIELWTTDQTAEELRREVETRGGFTLRSKVKLRVMQDLDHSDPAVRIATEKNVIAMTDHDNKHLINSSKEGSNVGAAPVNVNVQVNNTPAAEPERGVLIVRSDDFYRNDAHELERQRDREQAALQSRESAETSDGSADVNGTVQDADLRPPLGQNGNGYHGHPGRPRS